MNLMELRSRLEAKGDAELIFSTGRGPIGQGYHLTELKHATVTGIDCGGRVATWTEAAMQLLDGDRGPYMTTAKFKDILDQSLAAVNGLGDAPLKVEFANGNAGLRLYRVSHVDIRDRRVLIMLEDDRAVCKPAAERGAANEEIVCCSLSQPSDACCA